MKGKAKKQAKILLPKNLRAPSDPSLSTPTIDTKLVPTGSSIPVTSRKQIFSSTLQDGPVLPPNEIRLVFESEFSTIREDMEQSSKREIPTLNEANSIREISGVEPQVSSQNQESADNASVPKCKVAEGHKKGCPFCSKFDPNETGKTGEILVRQPKNLSDPFCSSFRADISHVPEKLRFGVENSISMVAGPSNKRYHTRSSVASNPGRNLLTTLPELDETNDLFGVGPPEEEIIKTHDSASQHEFRYYDGIRQRYCSSFKGNGFDVPGIIRLPFDTNTSMSTIMNPANESQVSESFDSDGETLQNIEGTMEDSVVSTEGSLSPSAKALQRDKKLFCSSFRASLSRELSHMTFNQEKAGPILRPRTILDASISEEDEEARTLTATTAESEDKDYSEDCDSEESDEEIITGKQECTWMEEHLLCCSACNPIDTSDVGNDFDDLSPRRARKTKNGFICTICQKEFGRKHHLESHISAVHESLKPYSCSEDECNKSFAQKRDLNRHVLTVHEGQKSYACSRCKKKFGLKSTLDRHISTVHDSLKPYFCSECNKSFSRKEDLNKHVLTVHKGQKPFACSRCEKKFGHKGHMYRHILTVHEGKKPHECLKCEKSFGQKSGLVVHLQIHAGVKPHTCSECSKSFTHKRNLSDHMRAHGNDKPFQCPYCDKSYKTSSALSNHKKTHADNGNGTESDSE